MHVRIIGLNAAPERSGIAPYTSGLAEHLAAGGHDVRLTTAFPHYPEWCFIEGAPPRTATAVENDVHVTRLRHRLPKRGSSVSRVRSELSFGLRALLSRWGRTDVAVLVSPAMFSSALLVPRLKLTRTPFIVWVQDVYGLGVREFGDGGGLVARLVGGLEAWLLRQADAVVVIQEQMAATVLDLGVAADRVSVVRNWTHVRPAPHVDRDQVRAGLGWAAHETVVLHTGNMGKKQDLMNVVRAARVADVRGADVRFVLMGDGTERPELETAASSVRRLQMLPPQPAAQYPAVLQAADVLLVNEHAGVRGMALPSKLTSYFTSGRPVLAATDETSATAAELRRGSSGARVDPAEPEALLISVGALVGDPEEVERMTAAAHHYQRAVLSVEAAAHTFTRILVNATRPSVAPAERDLVRVPSTAGRSSVGMRSAIR